jgi:hypothetical protein
MGNLSPNWTADWQNADTLAVRFTSNKDTSYGLSHEGNDEEENNGKIFFK